MSATLSGQAWTPSYLGYVLTLTADDVLVPSLSGLGDTADSRDNWLWVRTAQRLAWQYGAECALEILNGYDAQPALLRAA